VPRRSVSVSPGRDDPGARRSGPRSGRMERVSPSASRPAAPAEREGRSDEAPASGSGRRLDGSMSLLVDVMTNTLDEAYAERAARRSAPSAAAGPSTAGAGPGARVTGVLLLVLLGLLTGTAVAQVRARAADGAGLRADLADEVGQRSAESERLEAETAALRAEVIATRDAALEADAAGRRLTERVRALELAAGTMPVAGPGVVLTVDDAPPDPALAGDGRPQPSTPLDGRVLDRDLQDIVNGLWAAGAEAIAVNGVRLSSRAAIRSAGEAVLVDFRPLSPPYRIEAIGRPAALEVDFLDGDAGRRLQTLASFSGITYELRRSDRLELPPATEPQLRSVRLPEEPS
jgi:uncharacterized protein YlxW (UPF0749 family)